MTQLDTLKQMDADLHAAFADAGLADTVAYTPNPAGPVVEGVQVYIDRAHQQIGEFGQIVAPRTEVGYVLATVTPTKGGSFTIDGETWINVDNIGNDGSLSRWVVRRG